MAKSQHVPADVKKQILDRIKEGGTMSDCVCTVPMDNMV